MESAFSAAARALSRGDPLLALKWLGERREPRARAMRGTALAQLGEYEKARAHLRAALRALAPEEGRLRARCLAAEAEIALATGDIRWNAEPVVRAIAELETAGDVQNASYLTLVAARAALRLGKPGEAQRLLGAAENAPPRPLAQALLELTRYEVFAHHEDAAGSLAALHRARTAAVAASIPALHAEVDRIHERHHAPAFLLHEGGEVRGVTFDEMCSIAHSRTVLVDAGQRVLRCEGARVSFARKPVLFELLRLLAERCPASVTRDELVGRGFGVRRPNDSHRIRLRVELGRLRKMVTSWIAIEASPGGYRIRSKREVALLSPLEKSDESRLLAVMRDGSAWSASSLSTALDTSPRTVQRALATLETAGSVASFGQRRARKWVRTREIPTELLLPDVPFGA